MTSPVTPQHKALFARITQGPAPYRRGPDETVKCAACGKFNLPSQVHCDQCGATLPEKPTEPDIRGPGEDIQCPVCKSYNAGDARYCGNCGARIPASAFEMNNPAAGTPVPPGPKGGD